MELIMNVRQAYSRYIDSKYFRKKISCILQIF